MYTSKILNNLNDIYSVILLKMYFNLTKVMKLTNIFHFSLWILIQFLTMSFSLWMQIHILFLYIWHSHRVKWSCKCGLFVFFCRKKIMHLTYASYIFFLCKFSFIKIFLFQSFFIPLISYFDWGFYICN